MEVRVSGTTVEAEAEQEVQGVMRLQLRLVLGELDLLTLEQLMQLVDKADNK
jgi:hypothetical protein